MNAAGKVANVARKTKAKPEPVAAGALVLDDRPIRVESVAGQLAAAALAGVGSVTGEARADVIRQAVRDARALVDAVDAEFSESGPEPAAVAGIVQPEPNPAG